MNENYSFSGEREPIDNSALTEKERSTITRLGLTPENISDLLEGEHFAEGSYAMIFDLPESNPRLVAKVWKNPKHDSDRASDENVALRLLRVLDYRNAPKTSGFLKSSKILFEE